MNLVHGLRTTCATGGFKLTKWVSSSRSVLATIPEEDRTKDITTLDLEKDKLPMERALGIQWDMETDAFFFRISPKQHHLITRRNILSIVNSIYDPFGFLAPVTGRTRREASGSICKLLFLGVVNNRQGRTNSKQVYRGQDRRVLK